MSEWESSKEMTLPFSARLSSCMGDPSGQPIMGDTTLRAVRASRRSRPALEKCCPVHFAGMDLTFTSFRTWSLLNGEASLDRGKLVRSGNAAAEAVDVMRERINHPNAGS